MLYNLETLKLLLGLFQPIESPMTKWLERRASVLKVVGSSPLGGTKTCHVPLVNLKKLVCVAAVGLFIYLSVYLSIYLSILSVYLSLQFHTYTHTQTYTQIQAHANTHPHTQTSLAIWAEKIYICLST